MGVLLSSTASRSLLLPGSILLPWLFRIIHIPIYTDTREQRGSQEYLKDELVRAKLLEIQPAPGR